MSAGRTTRRSAQTGDTLIEVLFAFAVLSLVIVGALTIMNQGTIASEKSIETTLVRQEIDGQATTLRFLHDAYVANYKPGIAVDPATPAGRWNTLINSLSHTSASSISGLTSCPKTSPPGSFVVDPTTAKPIALDTGMVPSVTYSQIAYTASGAFSQAQGIWIEGIVGNTGDGNTKYTDFHIVACWDSPGGGPPSTIATIVRLYEPAS